MNGVIFKMSKNKCKTCGGEGVAWLLVPCPDCKEGRKVKKITKRVTKNLTNDKIKTK